MKLSQIIFLWAPRILCILAICFISLFALDSFAPGLTLGQQLEAFAMHMIPSFVLLIFLIVAWKWELIGGLIFITLSLGFTPFIYSHNYAMNHSVWMSLSVIFIITFPFLVVGILFLISHGLKQKNQAKG
jgi:hypothetical protein